MHKSSPKLLRVLLLSSLTALVAACGGGSAYTHPNLTGSFNQQTANLLFERAAFDFQCPQDQVHLTRVEGESVVHATGCSKRGTYIGVPRDDSFSYDWRLDGDIVLSESAQAPITEVDASEPSESAGDDVAAPVPDGDSTGADANASL